MSVVMNANTFLFVFIFDMFRSFWREFSEEPDANFLYSSLRGGEFLICSKILEYFFIINLLLHKY